MRGDKTNRLMKPPNSRRLSRANYAAINFDAIAIADFHGRRIEHLAIQLHPPFGDQAFGISARSNPGAGKHLGNTFAVGVKRRGRG